jgi:carboxyl-terminal processing protease
MMKKIGNIFNKMNDEKFNLIDMIFVVIIFSLLSIIGTTLFQKYNKNNKQSNSIEDVYNQIVNGYYQDVNKEELANSAIDGMMKYLDENYSVYMDENKTNILNNELDGTYKGIGVVVQKKDEKITIYNVFKNSPADQAGLKVDDQIVKIDDLEVTDNLEEVVSYIKDHKDLAIVVKRHGDDVLINVSTTDIDNPVVSTKLLTNEDKKYGYIYLKSFTSASFTQFKNSLEELEKDNISGLIIDLRSNRGGYIEQATNIAELFLKKGKLIYSYKEKDKEEKITSSTDEKRVYPIVVLVNGSTASSAELLTLALKESYGAITVGTNTYGKGKIQEVSKVNDSSSIKYTTGLWYSPNHNNIDTVGIKPSVTVELSDKYIKEPTDKNDNQLAKALELIIKLDK